MAERSLDEASQEVREQVADIALHLLRQEQRGEINFSPEEHDALMELSVERGDFANLIHRLLPVLQSAARRFHEGRPAVVPDVAEVDTSPPDS